MENKKIISKRLHYVDIAKGILICLVICSHIDWIWTSEFAGFGIIQDISKYNYIYTSFYMPAFFMLSGLFLNASREIKNHLLSVFKSLFLPAFFFGIIVAIFNNSITSPIQFAKIQLVNGGMFWFIASLIVCRFICIFIAKLRNVRIGQLLVLLCPFLGFFLHEVLPEINVWGVKQAMLFVPFMWFGSKNLNQINKIYNYASIFTFSTLIIFVFNIYSNTEFPNVTGYISLKNIIDLLLSEIISFTGSISFICLCKYISHNRLFEYIGQNSMIVYFLNTLLIRQAFIIIQSQCNEFLINYPLFVYITLFSFTLVVSLIVSEFCKFKYTKFITGKF